MAEKKKEEFMAQLEHYKAVLDDLQMQRDLYRLKISEVDQAISSLRRLIPSEVKQELPPQDHSSTSKATVEKGIFAGMGVRWAILNLLNEVATGPMATGEIADALQRGGIVSEAANFAGNVSAVLSVMSNKRGEVESPSDAGWVVTETGRNVWAHIRSKKNIQQQQLSIASNVQ